MVRCLLLALSLLPVVALAQDGTSPVPAPFCSGEYADDFTALSPRARAFEQQQQPYTLCVRTSASYECPYYGADGTLRRTRRRAVAHGTAFAYQVQGGDTLLLTNQHVAEWPAVTDDEHRVDDIPAGCRRVSDNLKIVDNDADDYEADDLPLSRVVTDPQLDMAVLRVHAVLPVIPWRIGKSASLRERNVVDVRGFPLGAFKATSEGKVISAYDRDDYKDWQHDDFVVDALLSPGNSGSPVLAISCKTGEFELVGVYHAGYSRGSALNVVVGIEQIRDLMTTLKRSPRRDAPPPSDAASRAALADLLQRPVGPSFPFGPFVATVQLRSDGALLYQVLNRDYPFRTFPMLVVEDLPGAEPDTFGVLGAMWFGGPGGLKAYARSDLDAESLGTVSRALEALRRDGQAALQYQAADAVSRPTREQFDLRARLERTLRRAAASRADLSQQVAELADRLAPQAGDAGTSLAAAVAVKPLPQSHDAPESVPTGTTAHADGAAPVPGAR